MESNTYTERDREREKAQHPYRLFISHFAWIFMYWTALYKRHSRIPFTISMVQNFAAQHKPKHSAENETSTYQLHSSRYTFFAIIFTFIFFFIWLWIRWCIFCPVLFLSFSHSLSYSLRHVFSHKNRCVLRCKLVSSQYSVLNIRLVCVYLNIGNNESNSGVVYHLRHRLCRCRRFWMLYWRWMDFLCCALVFARFCTEHNKIE